MRLHNWKLVPDKRVPEHTPIYYCSRCDTTAFKEQGKYYSELITTYLCPEEDTVASRQYLINEDCNLCLVSNIINS